MATGEGLREPGRRTREEKARFAEVIESRVQRDQIFACPLGFSPLWPGRMLSRLVPARQQAIRAFQVAVLVGLKRSAVADPCVYRQASALQAARPASASSFRAHPDKDVRPRSCTCRTDTPDQCTKQGNYTVTLIAGDGIGPEIGQSVKDIFTAASVGWASPFLFYRPPAVYPLLRFAGEHHATSSSAAWARRGDLGQASMDAVSHQDRSMPYDSTWALVCIR
jgi:hypothetical protein